MNSKLPRGVVVALLLVFVAAACGDGDGQDPDDHYGLAVDGEDEFGKPTLGPTGWEEPAGKADAIQGSPGLLVDVDDEPTAVWEVNNEWSDRDTEAAREAGLAWEEDSGLSWEEKYHRWIDSFPRIDREGYGETFMIQTPYGTELPAPSLECAEVTIFLRVAFANWYELPFFMEGRDADGNRLYFGHFGIRTAEGSFGRMPRFRDAYDDFRELGDAVAAGDEEWPSDSQLAGRALPAADDDQQPMIGEDARTGAYFDEFFLNKRVGYYLLMNLTYFGSINLVDPVNTYHVTPESTRAGDTLLHRWQRTGIGHVMVVMNVETFEDDDAMQMEANVASGSMPRRQPLWENAASTKGQFTDERAGGPAYVDNNGGLKRWRVATDVGGRWTNVVPDEDADNYLSASDKNRIEERPERYQELLTELDDEERLQAIADNIEQAREHLRTYPASCVARDNRESSFDALYELGDELGMSRADVDAEYRKLEDYVFAPLVYEESKTCCWLSSTNDMYRLILDYNVERMAEAEEACLEPVVFKGRDDDGDGYQRFLEFAEEVGKGELWVDWSPDETCPQVEGDWVADVEQDRDWTDWCELDVFGEATTHSFHSDEVLEIPDNDPDGVVSTIDVDVEGTVETVELDLFIEHTYNGDLVVDLRKDDVEVEIYNGSGAGDDVLLVDHEVEGFDGVEASGDWELHVVDTMNLDVGTLEEWSLHLEIIE